MRLLDAYTAALSDFHDSQLPLLAGNLMPDDPAFHPVVRNKERAHSALLSARRSYWQHLKEHGCRRWSNQIVG